MAKTPKKQDEYQRARRFLLITKTLRDRFDRIRQIENRQHHKKDRTYISRDTLAEQIIEEYVKTKEKEYEKIIAIMNKADKQISAIMEKTDEQIKEVKKDS